MNKIKENRYFFLFIIITIGFYIDSYINLGESVLCGDGYVMFQYFVGFFIKPEWYSIELIKYPCGTTLLQLPFLILKLFLLHISGFNEFSSDLIIQKMFENTIFISTLFYYVLSMFFCYKILKPKYGGKVSTFTCACLTYGTMVPYYVLQNASYSHIYGLFVFSLYLYLIDKYEKSNIEKKYQQFVLGIVLGVAFLVRNTHIIFFVAYLLYGVIDFKSLKERVRNIFRVNLLFQIAGFILTVSVQFILWWIQTGHMVLYSYSGESFDYLLNPQIVNVLFSDAKGLFIYSPVLFLGLICMFIYKKNFEEYSISLMIIFILTTYIISSWGCWWLGVCYSERMYCDILMVFAFPFAELFQEIGKTIKKKVGGFNSVLAYGIVVMTILYVLINLRWLSLVLNGKLLVTMNYWSVLKNVFFS